MPRTFVAFIENFSLSPDITPAIGATDRLAGYFARDAEARVNDVDVE
jgi:hypothetical protein